MFAPARGRNNRTYVITPCQNPNADFELRQMFYPNKNKRRTWQQTSKWASTASLPPPRTVPGVGKVTMKRDTHGNLIRQIVTTTKQVIHTQGDNFQIILKEKTVSRPQSATPLTTRTTPLIQPEATALNLIPIPNLSETVTSTDLQSSQLPKYWKKVDRISIPSNFIRLKNPSNLSKTQLLQMYPYRNIFQGTKTTRHAETGELTTEYDGSFYAETFTVREKTTKNIEPFRPKSAPITNIKRCQRVARDRLSTPSRFLSLGKLYKNQTLEEMQKLFPKKKISRRLRELPGENSLLNVSVDQLDYRSLDDDLWEWIVEAPLLSNSTNGEPRVTQTKYQPKVILKNIKSLEGDERADHMLERSAILAVPKPKFDKKTGLLKQYARNDNDDLIAVEIFRGNKSIAEIKEEIRKKLEDEGAKTIPRSAYMSKDERMWLRKAVRRGTTVATSEEARTEMMNNLMKKYTVEKK